MLRAEGGETEAELLVAVSRRPLRTGGGRQTQARQEAPALRGVATGRSFKAARNFATGVAHGGGLRRRFQSAALIGGHEDNLKLSLLRHAGEPAADGADREPGSPKRQGSRGVSVPWLRNMGRNAPNWSQRAYSSRQPGIQIVDATVIGPVASRMDRAKHRGRKDAAKGRPRPGRQRFPPRMIIADSRAADPTRAPELCAGLEPGEIVIFNKACVDCPRPLSQHGRGVSWVTRRLDRFRHKVERRKKGGRRHPEAATGPDQGVQGAVTTRRRKRRDWFVSGTVSV